MVSVRSQMQVTGALSWGQSISPPPIPVLVLIS